MHVLMVIQSHADSSARVRALAWRGALSAMHIESSVAEAAPGRRARAELIWRAGAADVVFLQRKLLNRWDLRNLRKAAKTLVFDFDDAIFIKDDPAGARRSRTREARFGRAAALADRIIAGNAYLAGCVPERSRDKVTVIPSVADTTVYAPRSAARNETPLTVGWLGSRSTLPYLESVAAPLARVQKATGCRVVVVADRAPRMDAVDVEFHPWTLATEVGEVQAMDIGIMPLPDSPWTRGKCGYKLILYLSCAVPVVADAVGVNNSIVRHGHTGLLVRTEDEWERALLRLLRDEDMRRRFGRRGRADMIENYSLYAWAQRFVEVVAK